jgi:hypothetical protein
MLRLFVLIVKTLLKIKNHDEILIHYNSNFPSRTSYVKKIRLSFFPRKVLIQKSQCTKFITPFDKALDLKTGLGKIVGHRCAERDISTEGLKKPSPHSLKFIFAEEPTRDKKRKKEIFFLVITDLSFFGTPDNKSHNDAENSPDNKIGTEQKDEKSCSNDGTGDNKATQDN